MHKLDMYKLDIFCTPTQKNMVLETLHQQGVDKVGNYDHCWTISLVEGSHRALEGANPVFGASGAVESYPLVKIEINMAEPQISPLLRELKCRLGWEEPMVNIFKLHNQYFE